METIFMETTVQADKFLGKKTTKNYIENVCKDKRLVSSTYVLGEFKANFLKDAIALYNLVKDSDDVGESVIRFEESYSKRITSRMCKLFGNLIRECGVDDKTEIMDRLEIYIEDILIERFNSDLDEILINNTSCLRALVKPEKVGNTWKINVGCRQNPIPKCNIHTFLTKTNINDLKKLINLPPSLEKIKTVVDEVVQGSSKPYGNKCRTLGDAIISLESPKNASILTTNKKDYQPICNCLNKCVL